MSTFVDQAFPLPSLVPPNTERQTNSGEDNMYGRIPFRHTSLNGLSFKPMPMTAWQTIRFNLQG